MSVDLATLAIDVDASQASKAATQLDGLTAAGTRAEAATGKLKSATSALSAEQLALGDKTLSAAKASDLLAKRADKLLSQMDPMYKAQKAYAAQLAEIELLNNAGAISESERAAVTIAAEKAIAEATTKAAAVQVAAHEAVAGSSIKIRESLVLLREASVGNYTRMAGSASILAGAFGVLEAALIPIGVLAVSVGGTVAGATQQINQSAGDLTKGLGLTADQLARVKDKTVTFMDTLKASFQVIGKDIESEFTGPIAAVGKAWQTFVDDYVKANEVVAGTAEGTAYTISEAWKSVPTWLGGEGKSFSASSIESAFSQGFAAAKVQIEKFMSDVSQQAKGNRVAEILTQAGKPGRTPRLPGQGELNSASKQLTETQNQAAAQTALNKAVSDGTLTMTAANQQNQIDSQLKNVIAERDNASGVLKQKLTAIINQLIPATQKLISAQNEWKVLQDNDKQKQANDLLEAEIKLAGKSAEQRAVEIAQLKQMQALGLNKGDPRTAAQNKSIGLAGKNASDTYTLGLVNSVSNDNDIGTQNATGYVNAAKANDPGAAYKQQQAAYAAIDKLRQADRISEEVAARAKGLADADYNQARLQSATDMFGQLATLSTSKNKELAAIGKAAAIVQATIDGVLAVQKALSAYPPPYNFVMAGAVGLVAAVNVAKIAGLKDGGMVRGPGGPRDDKVLMWGSNGEFMVNATATARNRDLLEAMNSGADVSGGSMPARANGGYIGPAMPARSTANAPRIEINNYGTSKGFDVQHVSDDHIRIIARDEDHKNTPKIMASETANRNSKFRRQLAQNTKTQNKMIA